MAKRTSLPPRMRPTLTTFAAGALTLRQGRRAQGLLWVAEGVTVRDIARRLQVSRQTVYVWQGWLGWAGDLAARLADRPRSGRPRTTGQAVEAGIAAVIGTDPRQHGDRMAGWTTGLLRQQLRQSRDGPVSERTVRCCLRRLGATRARARCWRAARAPGKRGLQRGLSARRRTVLLFMDEMIITETPPLRAAWALQGQQAEVPITGNRAKRILYGVLNPKSSDLLLSESLRWNQVAVQRFFLAIRSRWRG